MGFLSLQGIIDARSTAKLSSCVASQKSRETIRYRYHRNKQTTATAGGREVNVGKFSSCTTLCQYTVFEGSKERYST